MRMCALLPPINHARLQMLTLSNLVKVHVIRRKRFLYNYVYTSCNCLYTHTQDDDTALHWAALKGQLSTTRELVQAKAPYRSNKVSVHNENEMSSIVGLRLSSLKNPILKKLVMYA